MGIENVSWEMVVGAGAIILLGLNAYNTAMTAREHREKKLKERQRPVLSVEETLAKHQEMLATDKRRIDRLETDVEDVRNGQKALVKGVQALLEHELHNGNSEQMEKASSGLNEWLVNGR